MESNEIVRGICNAINLVTFAVHGEPPRLPASRFTLTNSAPLRVLLPSFPVPRMQMWPECGARVSMTRGRTTSSAGAICVDD